VDKKDWQKKGAGHRQRLRDKFIEKGIGSFTDAEILELLLSLGTPRQDCKERARAAIKRFGSLAAVLETPLETLQEIKGIGPNNAFAVRFVHETARKFLKERPRGKSYINAASEVVEYLRHSMTRRETEVFVAIFLDSRNGVIDIQELFQGTLSSSAVYPREVIKTALSMNAAAMVFAHNHPSGHLEPSPADHAITRRLFLAAKLMEMNVLDHIIIGNGEKYYSFAEHGIMDEICQANASLL
jgi:DNA repair protein RadC